MRRPLLTATAALLLLAAPAQAQTAGLLWDQGWYFESHTGYDVLSFDEELSDRFDTEVADDIVVPAGDHWDVTELRLRGSFGSGCRYAWHRGVVAFVLTGESCRNYPIPREATFTYTLPTQYHVSFHPDAGGVPGVAAHTLSLRALDSCCAYPLFRFQPAVSLSAGRWWIRVQADEQLRELPADRWFWRVAAGSGNGHSAVVRTPGGARGATCATWQPVGACAYTGEVDRQPVFSLVGRRLRPDAVAPDTSFAVAPPAVTSRDPTFSLAGTEPGGTFWCKLDAGTWQQCPRVARFGNLPDGRHTFAARAADAAGNRDATPAVVTWRVDGAAAP